MNSDSVSQLACYIIHMNGRVYDYNVGRFLSVDPFVHGGSQGINPYSYILNNPLAGTDPSGYSPCAEGEVCNLEEVSSDEVESLEEHDGGSVVVNFKDGTSVVAHGRVVHDNGSSDINSANRSTLQPRSSSEIGSQGQTATQTRNSDNQQGSGGGKALKAIAAILGRAASGVVSALIPANETHDENGYPFGELRPATNTEVESETDRAMNNIDSHFILNKLSPKQQKTLQKDLASIRTKKDGPQAEQYALLAAQDGTYVCYHCDSGTIQLNAGEVWKYGVTNLAAPTRYSQPRLDFSLAGGPLRQETQMIGTRKNALLSEKLKIYRYEAQHGVLPPGNKIHR